MFSGHTREKPNRHERSRTKYLQVTDWVKVTPTNQSRADLIWRQNGDSTTTLQQKCIVNGFKTVQVAGNGVTLLRDTVHYSGSALSLSRSRHSDVMGTWFAFIIFPCVASIQHWYVPRSGYPRFPKKLRVSESGLCIAQGRLRSVAISRSTAAH